VSKSRLVYSTDSGRVSPARSDGPVASSPSPPELNDGVVRVPVADVAQDGLTPSRRTGARGHQRAAGAFVSIHAPRAPEKARQRRAALGPERPAGVEQDAHAAHPSP